MQLPRPAPVYGGHEVTAAYRPVTAGAPVRIRLVSPFLAVVKKISSDSAKVGFRVQFPAAGPFYSRVVKHKSWHASNVPFRVGIPARGPIALVAEHTGGGVLTRTMQVRILPGAPIWMGNCLSRRSPLSKSGGRHGVGVQVLTHPPFTARKLMHDEHSLDKGEAVGANPTRATFGGLNRRVPMPVC